MDGPSAGKSCAASWASELEWVWSLLRTVYGAYEYGAYEYGAYEYGACEPVKLYLGWYLTTTPGYGST